eukprot:1161215-Pelagomonas_calceolata.AAC.1
MTHLQPSTAQLSVKPFFILVSSWPPVPAMKCVMPSSRHSPDATAHVRKYVCTWPAGAQPCMDRSAVQKYAWTGQQSDALAQIKAHVRKYVCTWPVGAEACMDKSAVRCLGSNQSACAE